MTKSLFLGAFIVALISFSLPVGAQTPPKDPYAAFRESGDEPYHPGEIEPEVSRYESAEALFEDLIRPGRCEVKMSEKRGVPCALIQYPGGSAYRAVFKINNKKTIFTFLDTKLAQVSVDDLWAADDLSGPSGELRRYEPVRIIGYDENHYVCSASGDSCIEEKHFTRFLDDHEVLTIGCRSRIWGNSSNPIDRDLAARCRLYVPRE